MQQIQRVWLRFFATDGYKVYPSLLNTELHLKGKDKTYTVEAKNNQIRHYLARFKRKTHCYSKSLEMVVCSLNLLFHKLSIVN